jgi:hypothetical protein
VLSLIVGSLCIGMTATDATAQQRTAAAQSTTVNTHDVNGNDSTSEKVTTRRSQSDGREEEIIETYSPSMQWGRVALTRRVRRITTETSDGSYTVEETEALNHAEPSAPLRLIQRVVTTVRHIGENSYETQRQVFEMDVNGRLVLRSNEHTSVR